MTSPTHSDRDPAPRARRTRRKSKSPALAVLGAVGKVLGTLVLIGIVTGVILVCFAANYIRTVIVPQAHLEADFVMNQTSTIYYMDAETGQYVEHLSLHGTENRKLVDLEQIPEDLINATIAIEDETFREHHGVNWKRTLYGVILMFTGGDIQGGSTITQQLIKNATQYDDVTVKRKILEIFTALDFEKNYSKDQIMEWYLNLIYLGDSCYGVATAAENYFGKDVSELSLAECASIIAITNNPTIYGPNSSIRMTNEEGEVTTGRERNKDRQELVLWKMMDVGMIDQATYEAACAQELDFVSDVDEERPAVIYNWYDEQVITDVRNDLMEQYGYSEQLATNIVFSGGLKIYACVDEDIQTIVESVYSDRSNLDLTSRTGQKIQSAIVIIDPQGNVVGLAGALGEKTSNRGWNYASRSLRQPGSSIKPLSVYAPGLEYDVISPATVLDDYPVELYSGSAWPNNSYSYYRGLTNLAPAIAVSSNPAAVRALEMLGVERSFQFMQENMHIDLTEELVVGNEVHNDYGTSQLALGGLTTGVRVIDMAAAYSVFPRDGLYIEPRTYTRVTREVDGHEEVLLDNSDTETQVAVSPETCWYINELLQNVVNGSISGATGTNARISGMTVAGKTGSTSSNNDRWFVGYTPYYTAAVWIGYNNPERIETTGGNPAVRMWQKVMAPVHEGLENKDFSSISGTTTVQICQDSGLLASEACALDPRGSRVMNVTLLQEDAPTERCAMHVEVEVCTGCPVLDANGEAISGLYHLAGEFCPRSADETGAAETTGAAGTTTGTTTGAAESTVKTIGILDYAREQVGSAVARDSNYLKSFLDEQGACTVHTSAPEPVVPYDPYSFNRYDPDTWPTQEQWPGFDPADETTWPDYNLPPIATPTPGGETTPPVTEPTPGASDTPTPEPTPSATPTDTPPAEPFVPAGG